MEKLKEYKKLIEQWSIDKGLNDKDPKVQILKVTEEFGEIDEAKTDQEMMDAIGDSYVTLVVIAQQLKIDEFNPYVNSKTPLANLGRFSGYLARSSENTNDFKKAIESLYDNLLGIARYRNLTFVDCVEVAYNVIKNRKGKMIGDTFVKEEDL